MHKISMHEIYFKNKNLKKKHLYFGFAVNLRHNKIHVKALTSLP